MSAPGRDPVEVDGPVDEANGAFLARCALCPPGLAPVVDGTDEYVARGLMGRHTASAHGCPPWPPTPESEPTPEPEPGPYDMRRLTIEIECDVNLAAVSAARRDHPSPHDIVTHVDRQVVAAVEALPGVSATISRRLSMRDQAGRAR